MLIWRVMLPPTSVMDDIKIKVGKVIGESSKYQKKKMFMEGQRVAHTYVVPVSQMSVSTELEI